MIDKMQILASLASELFQTDILEENENGFTLKLAENFFKAAAQIFILKAME